MPLYEYRCKSCDSITEALVPGARASTHQASCASCGSVSTVRIFSRVSVRIAAKPKYNEEFVGKALPFLKQQRETAGYFAEGHGSDEAKATQLAERIGTQIDHVLDRSIPNPKQ